MKENNKEYPPCKRDLLAYMEVKVETIQYRENPLFSSCNFSLFIV
jgi:hypothetical protein